MKIEYKIFFIIGILFTSILLYPLIRMTGGLNAGVLTKGRILFEKSGIKDEDKEKEETSVSSIEPGTALEDATEGKVLYHIEFWDAIGKRRVGVYIPVECNNVRIGVSYGSNSSLVGTLSLPSPDKVLSGINYGAGGNEFTGTYTSGSNDAGTSTNDADPGTVLTNREYWHQDGTRRTGFYFPVTVNNVRSGISFGSNQNLTGTFTSDATAGEDDIMAGKTAYSNGIKLTGTLPLQGDVVGTEGTLIINLADGIYKSRNVTARDGDLKPGNIRKGVNIFGTNGSFVGAPLRTGQITVYRTGDDAYYRKGYSGGYTNSNGTWNGSTRFTDHGNNTVTDNLTGLMWTKNANILNAARTWDYAIGQAEAGYNVGGYTDWRLPNQRELYSLIEDNNYDPVLPTGHPFLDVKNDYYWTSTTCVNGATSAVYLDVGRGNLAGDNKGNNHYVWYVRGGE